MNVELTKLTTEELLELRARIDKRLRDFESATALSPERIKEVVCHNCCMSDDELPTRMRDAVTAKVIISNIMLELGFTAAVVGKLVGQDHATISHYKHNLADWKACPAAYRREMRLYNKSIKDLDYETQ